MPNRLPPYLLFTINDPDNTLQPDPNSYNFSTSLMVYDSLGTPRTATMYFAKATYMADVDDDSGNLSIDPAFASDSTYNVTSPTTDSNPPTTTAAYDAYVASSDARAAKVGTAIPLTWNTYVGMEDEDGYVRPAAVSSNAVTGIANRAVFDANGELLNINGVGDPNGHPAVSPGLISLDFPPSSATGFPNGASQMTAKIDLAGTTQYGQQYTVNDLKQDGFTTGRLDGIDVDETGIVFARYTNGRSEALGQIALANFANPQGLQKLGDNTWAENFVLRRSTHGLARHRRSGSHPGGRTGVVECRSRRAIGEADHRATQLSGERADHLRRRYHHPDHHQYLMTWLWEG